MFKNDLLEPDLCAGLEGYRLVRRSLVPEGYAGSRRSLLKGGAVEFADYREYTYGDEPRRVDWKAYARLRRLYVKEYVDERQYGVIFIIDTSASMDWGPEGEHKGRRALQLAAGLGICALVGGDRLVASSRPESNDNVFLPAAGRQALPRFWSWLKGQACGGVMDFAGSLRAALQLMPAASGLYLFSDLLDPAGVEALVHEAAARGMEITLLHTLAPAELDPPLDGDWTLVDAETGQPVEVSVTPAVLSGYARRLEEFLLKLDNLCRRYGARRILIDTGRSPEDILLRTLPRRGILSC